MYAIVADADGLIKVGKSGALPALLSAARVIVPQVVWEEAVEEGKKRMYEDAQVLEQVLSEGGAEVVAQGPCKEADALLGKSSASFGAGERSALAAFYATGAGALLTDDRAFVGLLAAAEPHVPVLVPAAAIVSLAEAGRLSTERAREALGKLEGAVRKSALGAALDELDAIEKHRKGERR